MGSKYTKRYTKRYTKQYSDEYERDAIEVVGSWARGLVQTEGD
ncbi:hypothetical protein [Streptomyces sp. NPDC059928]